MPYAKRTPISDLEAKAKRVSNAVVRAMTEACPDVRGYLLLAPRRDVARVIDADGKVRSGRLTAGQYRAALESWIRDVESHARTRVHETHGRSMADAFTAAYRRHLAALE
jgi:hypothetical protein